MLADILSLSAADAAIVFEFVLALATVGLAISTFALAYYTRKSVQQATKLLERQIEPFVYIEPTWNRDLPFAERPLVIFIKNKGGGPARDITFDVKDDFPVEYQKTTFNQSPIIKNKIKELAPNQEISLAWLSMPVAAKIERDIKIEFRYKDMSDKTILGFNFVPFPTLISSA